MTDRPILFSGPMVRALLAGVKTQTRRLDSASRRKWAAGDRLWVREQLQAAFAGVHYAADGIVLPFDVIPPGWTMRDTLLPPMFMPRWASRLTLTITEVRRQKLEQITESDALAEGVTYFVSRMAYVPAYRMLWDGLHPRPEERWDRNPDVIALTFTVEQRNIAQ